jgi:mRNA interferase RelE/StbE
MKVKYKASFLRDLKQINNKKIKKQIEQIINTAKSASQLSDIPNIRKLRGYKNFYRIRIGNYRIGLYFEEKTIIFVRVLHRKDFYKYFP